ncbi:MAG: response regulator [Anaerolineales bacterium]|jgi:two-component system cell cycle response regulator DivK|nr:response regulator [Chloroflexota bacterium]MBK6646605.1 response regulator [Anaerolineales bacterium]MCC6986270.1 response regulator [Anaerolineales bacterium]
MSKPTALIVEDDRDIVALFRHVLDIAGYQTEIVLDGKDAMDRLGVIRPNIVLLDLQLPRMSGVEILKRMRDDERLMRVPVVVITAYAPYADSLPVEPDLLLLKPVDINQLSSLVQRLQATQGALDEPAHDFVTGLYTLPFFNVRMTFSLERIKQSSFRRFGVLFADVTEMDELKLHLDENEMRDFLRKLADQFRVTLRPTDTMAWSSERGLFFTLIEDIPTPEAPLKIAGRLRDSMKRYLESNDRGIGLRANVGVLLCDAEYDGIEQILDDIEIARSRLREGLFTNPSIFDREMLGDRG